MLASCQTVVQSHIVTVHTAIVRSGLVTVQYSTCTADERNVICKYFMLSTCTAALIEREGRGTGTGTTPHSTVPQLYGHDGDTDFLITLLWPVETNTNDGQTLRGVFMPLLCHQNAK